MSCLSPINIIPNSEVNKCVNKCNLTYSNTIAEQQLAITNEGTYLQIMVSNTENTAQLDNSSYVLSEIQIFSPSLHEYNSSTQIGEIFMVYTSTEYSSTQLIISVAISQSNGSINDNGFNNLMNAVSIYTPSSGQTMTYVVPELNFNTFIANKPYYTYSGNVINDCITPADYIVYYPTTFSIFISNDYLTNGQINFITPYSAPIQPNPDYYYNEKGPNFASGDGIYMDCVAVNSSTETQLMNVASSNSASSYGSYSSSVLKNPTLMKVIQFGVFCLFIIVIFGILYFIIKLLTGYLGQGS
jgi:Eukaryotic-type carbonic anhydrase